MQSILYRGSLQKDISDSLAKVGQIEEALAVAGEIEHGRIRSLAYREAREVAEQCSRAVDQLAAFAAILREYRIERHPDQAKLFEEEPEKEK